MLLAVECQCRALPAQLPLLHTHGLLLIVGCCCCRSKASEGHPLLQWLLPRRFAVLLTQLLLGLCWDMHSVHLCVHASSVCRSMVPFNE